MFGQEIIREDKDGWIDVKYKDSWTYTVMPKKEYYLQLWTFCDDFGSWLDYPISDIFIFFVKSVFPSVSPCFSLVSEFSAPPSVNVQIPTPGLFSF